ncbi:polysaccharide deacetylase family protein [Thermobispora bispora]|jgi:peptidoglycan/xylan/chitin deacetylase (PgdA/CDA1 family)|uniref:Polysaccharide deacetylase n=1 Tax=Thermobispora bispora (strain ATCC 19993 / DSM 43833 / CBS 139.67 / JCM 10125 / KCTC 9307 / NBRC 14880 / R51) TaxID=469371 RepID=D6Y652_THEBD|nr:polysaccharide deacetylase family protein [Thermobispora bispora]ADG89468.1 polysaccharide deacetylase [Thermobispora bispora DSM 43833]
MRKRSVLLALLLLAGCGMAEPTRPATTAPGPKRVFRHRTPPAQDLIGMRLVSAQRDWPGPRLPVAPPPRTIDCSRLKCVALTFDDGPGEETGRLLDILAAHHARATFFVLGRMVDQDETTRGYVRRMVSEGHEIGNHSWSHPALTGLSAGGVREELDRTQQVVMEVAGVRMRIMRPPYGATGQGVEKVTRDAGLAQILWTLDTFDWRDRNADTVAKRAAQAKPGDIVLLHDIHATTIEAVPRILAELDRKGYTYVTVSELLGDVTPGKQYVKR